MSTKEKRVQISPAQQDKQTPEVQATPDSAEGRQQDMQGSQQQQQDNRAMLPRVDVLEDEAGITLLADLPGVPKEGLELRIEGDTLLIEGTIAPLTPQQLEPLYAEVRVPRYRRVFTLSRELDTERIEALLKDGVLNLRIPKQEHAQPRRIQVQVD